MDSDSDRLQGAGPSLHSGPVPVGRVPAARLGSGPLLENRFNNNVFRCGSEERDMSEYKQLLYLLQTRGGQQH